MTDRFEEAAREIQRQMIKAYDSSFPLAQALRTQWNDALEDAIDAVQGLEHIEDVRPLLCTLRLKMNQS